MSPKTKSEKSLISAEFARLREYGYLVFNFNQKTRFGPGMVGFCDHLIIGFGRIVFIEVKIGKDQLSKEQEQLKDELVKAQAEYNLVTCLYDAQNISDWLISSRFFHNYMTNKMERRR